MEPRSVTMIRHLLLYLPLLGATACTGSGPPPETAEASWQTAVTRKATYEVSWRPSASTVPLNQHFDVEVRVNKGGTPVEDAAVVLRCDMPEHGHGMNVVPQSAEAGGGLYRVEGVLLHMRGRWVMTIDVLVDGSAESTEFELQL